MAPRRRRIYVRISRHDVEVACKHDRYVCGLKRGRMTDKSLEPSHLVFELRPWLWIAVRKVETRDKNTLNCCFNITGLLVGRITRQLSSGQNWLGALAKMATSFHWRCPCQTTW